LFYTPNQQTSCQPCNNALSKAVGFDTSRGTYCKKAMYHVSKLTRFEPNNTRNGLIFK
jgi:hypothetical protein